MFLKDKSFALMIRKFFFFFKILRASFSKPLAITTSRKTLFNSIAKFLLIL